MPTKLAAHKAETETEDQLPQEQELAEENPESISSAKPEEMRINFDYPNEEPKAETMGEEEENRREVRKQVSNLDDLLDKPEYEEKGPVEEVRMPAHQGRMDQAVEIEESPLRRHPVEDLEEVVDPRTISEEEEPGIRHIKHPAFTRNIGDEDLPVNYQNAHFPHDNFGQNPLYANQEKGPKPKKGNKFYLLLLLIIGILVIGGAVLVLKHKIALPFMSAKPSPTPEASIVEQTPEPSPTSAPIDRSKFKIQVLNGTGKAGLAASVSAQLKSLGYQTDKTSNATNSAFKRTTIQVKSDADGLLDQLIGDLAPTFDATGTPTLKSSNANDAEIILGEQ